MIDARGLACPMPVLKVQQAVKKDHPVTLEVMVDNNTAVQNVTRFANNSGYAVSVKELEDEEFSLTLTKK
ncbi:MAG: recombinase [Ruminococcaceae bacterium]|nr:recombinase [Oscillospiraceae bacterium]